MDDVRIGRVCRALRRRRGWRQLDLAVRAGCHQTTVSRIERGQVDALAIRSVRAVFIALEARYDADVRWRGADVDRLLDERHALLVELAAARFAAAGWEVIAEASFSSYGERGSIDLLAGHALTRVAVIGEIKTAIGDVQETLRRHDVKARLGRQVAAERFGWTPDRVVRGSRRARGPDNPAHRYGARTDVSIRLPGRLTRGAALDPTSGSGPIRTVVLASQASGACSSTRWRTGPGHRRPNRRWLSVNSPRRVTLDGRSGRILGSNRPRS